MKRLTNIQFANSILFEIKEAINKKPTHDNFSFKVNMEILSEQFNERVLENIICTEIKCTIEIIKLDTEFYEIRGRLKKWPMQSDLDFLSIFG